MIPRIRAWDSQKKKMYPSHELGKDDLTISCNGKGFINVSGTSPSLSQLLPHLIPLLYVGLEDHNKNDVCEGDVLNDLKHPEQYFEVKWSEGKFYLDLLIPKLSTGGMEDIDTVSEMEIVGNIHETPEFKAGEE